jgi:hypothetical protein
MAARLNRRHQDLVREKIKVSMIIDRLEKSVAGEIELSPTQVQSAKILLDKSISNAKTDLNVSGTVNVTWPEPKNKLDE